MSPLVSVEQVSKYFRVSKQGPQRHVLVNIWLNVEPGDVVALVGPNGAGKTTLLNIMAGFTIPTSGTVRIMGKDPVRHRTQLVRHLGVALDSARLLFMPLTVEQNLTYLAYLRGLPPREIRRTVTGVLEQVQAADLARKPALHLSRGQRQRVLLAAALLTDPAILLLDEPTSGLDPDVAEAFGAFLAAEARRGRAVVVASHDLAWLETVASRVLVLARGHIVAAGSLHELMTERHPSFSWWLRELPTEELRSSLRALGASVRDVNPASEPDSGASARVDLVTGDLDQVRAVFDTLHRAGSQVVEFRQTGGDLRQVYRDLIRAEQEELLERLRKREGKDP